MTEFFPEVVFVDIFVILILVYVKILQRGRTNVMKDNLLRGLMHVIMEIETDHSKLLCGKQPRQ